MPKAIIFSDGPEGLVQLQTLLNNLEAENTVLQESLPGEALQHGPLPPVERTDLVEDEDLRQIVQLRLLDGHESSPGYVIQRWADTSIDPEELDEYRDSFPEQEYRLVAVYDEIVTVDDSVDQQEVSAEDEIGQLKAEILQLKALIANYENAQ